MHTIIFSVFFDCHISNIANKNIFLWFYTTFTLEPTIADLKLIWISFKTSGNNIYQFPTVYGRLWKRNNDCFQFSGLHLSLIMTDAGDLWYTQNAASMFEISRILRFQLFTLQNYKPFKTQNENVKKSLRKLLRFPFYPFSL